VKIFDVKPVNLINSNLLVVFNVSFTKAVLGKLNYLRVCLLYF